MLEIQIQKFKKWKTQDLKKIANRNIKSSNFPQKTKKKNIKKTQNNYTEWKQNSEKGSYNPSFL